MIRIVARVGKPAPKFDYLHKDSGFMYTAEEVKEQGPNSKAVEEIGAFRSCFNKNLVVEADIHRKR